MSDEYCVEKVRGDCGRRRTVLGRVVLEWVSGTVYLPVSV